MQRKPRLLSRIVRVLGAVMLLLVLAPAPVALAETTPDPWADGLEIVNNTLGGSCTVTGTTPSLSEGMGTQLAGETLSASGSMACSANWEVIGVTVCIQFKEPVAPEDLTWQDSRCNSEHKTRSSNVSATVSALCLPGMWKYRTVVVGEAHKVGVFSRSMTYVSPPVTATCSV